MAEKTLSFKINIQGVSTEEEQISKLSLQIKNLSKEIKALETAMNKGIASREQIQQHAALTRELNTQKESLSNLKKVVDTAADSITRKRAALSQLKKEYYDGDAALRNNLLPQINKLTSDISKAEKAIGVHSRGVGGYKEGIKEAARELTGFASAAALGVAVLDKFKDAFKETEMGVKFFRQLKEAATTYFQSVITGNLNMAGTNALVAIEVAKELDVLRIRQREEHKRIAELDLEIKLLRLKGASTKDLIEQSKIYTEADKLEDERIKVKTDDLEEEIRLLNILYAIRQKDSKLADEINKKEIELIEARGEKNVRIQSKIAATNEKLTKEKEDSIEKIRKKEEEFAQEQLDRLINLDTNIREGIEKRLKAEAEAKEKQWRLDVDFGKLVFDRNQREAKEAWDAMLQRDKDEIERQKKKEETITQFKKAGFEGSQMGADAVFNAKKSRLNAEMEAELSKENITEGQKAVIRKKYAKEQQRIDINQALINTALAIGNALATSKPFFPTAIIGAAMAALQGGIQVATIKAQKYATGGKIQGGFQVHSDTSRDNTLIYAKQGETVLNERQIAALGGSATMRRIKVPGYANGGYIGQQAPEIPAVGFDYAAMARLMNSIEVNLNIHKLNSAQREVHIITETQRI